MKKQNNTAMAHSAKPHKKRPFRLLALLAMLALAPALWAQDPGQYPYPANVNDLPEWNGENDGKFKITADSTKINSTVDVHSDGGTPRVLVLYPVGTPVVVKETTNAELFKVRDKGELHIIGRVGDTLKIYGNCGNGTATNPTPIPTRTNYQGSCILSIGTASLNPKIWLKYVEFYGFVTHTSIDNVNGNNTGQGGIVTMGASASPVVGACHMKHVTFKNSYGGPVVTNHYRGYGRIISFVSGTWTVTLDNVKIHDCLISEPLSGYYLDGGIKIGGMGSVIRSQGQVGGSLTMTKCVAYNNTYRDLSGSENNSILDYKNMNQIKSKPLSGQGGVVNWRSGRIPQSGSSQVTLDSCKFHDNSAQCGGAVATCAAIKMKDTEIWNNEAERGGGVYFYTYNGGDAPYDGHGFRATFDDGVDIHHNSASKYGGGVYLTFDASDDVGFLPDGSHTPMSPEFSLNINTGSKIHNNKAPKGSGIALMDACPYSHCFYGTNNWSLEYQRTVNVNGGKVYDNYAEGTEGSKMAGGGIYIEKYEYYEDHPLFKFHKDYTDHPDYPDYSGILTVNLLSGEIYGNSAVNDDIPGYGGGLYISSDFGPDILSTLNVNIGDEENEEAVLEIYGNEAYTDGGGVYVLYDLDKNPLNEGIVKMTGGVIGKDDSDTGNKALTGNGGGLCVMGGVVQIAGGSIEHNTANLDGGGVYVSVSANNPDTWVYDGTSISHNTAGENGGGVYVDYGQLYIYYDYPFDSPYGLEDAEDETIHTRITKNKALGGNGGGVYLGMGYLEIDYALLYDNEAYGDGGGAHVEDEGQIFFDDSKLLKNTAGGNGGGGSCWGLYGEFFAYESDVSYNTAGGNGGGVYVETGYLQFINSDFEMISTISHNTAGGNGGGLYNADGWIDLTFATVHDNEAGYDYSANGTSGGNGGGVYCNNENDYGQPDIRFMFTDFYDNKAHGDSDDTNDPTGCGGAFYVQKGRVYTEYNTLFGNTAEMSGGGIYCHDGELRSYGAVIGSEDRGNTATNGRGGGIITHQGNITIGPCDTYYDPEDEDYADLDMVSYIEHNTAKTDGGGICNLNGDITVIRSGVNHNTAETGKGGGVFITGGDLTMLGGQINENLAEHRDNGKGGGVYSGGGTFQIMERQPNPIVNIYAFEDNGAYYNFIYKMTHQGLAMTEGYDLYHGISYTTDPDWGDSTYVVCDTLYAGIVEGRVVYPFAYDVFDENTTYYFKACAWYEDGEGNVYYGETPVLESFIMGYKAVGKGIRRPRSIYPSSEEKHTHGKAKGKASNRPRSIYPAVEEKHPYDKAMGKASNRPRSIYPAVEENPFFMELTPLQQAIMAHTPEGDSTTPRKRKHRPVRDGEPTDTPEINNNSAIYGGGVYVDNEDAKLIFSGGEIKGNFASEAGGGVYITHDASMQMKHHCQVISNHVPASKAGGGIYLDGNFRVGDREEDEATEHSLKVNLNWAGDGAYSDAERNNVHLPLAPVLGVGPTANKRVVTLLSDISGKTNGEYNTLIGITVDRGFREVIYSENDEHVGGAVSTKQWLEELMPTSGNILNSALFDDTRKYYALHVTPSDGLFDEDYIYFWSCWTTIVSSDPNEDGTGTVHFTASGSGTDEVWHINTNEGLAWFSSRINGLNGLEANPAAKAFVENDLDMSAYLWVPLGSVSNSETVGTEIIFTPGGQYSGEFDGQGNIISGLICTYMTGIFKYGLFGTLADGAKVKNTFIDDYMFTSYKQKDPTNPGSYINNPAYKMGGIAAEMDNSTAVISNCEARGQMKAVICDAANTYVGGIAGDVQQGAIHSCMAMPTITGTAQYMGGLAGNLAAATTLKNSYANVLFSTTPTPAYPVGGIAGVNNGTIENVYVRYNNATNTPDLANTKFYWIAGLNQGSILYCFSPESNTGSGKWDYTGPSSTAATKRRTYQPTVLVNNKYGFAHDDQKAEAFDNNTDGTDFIPMENGNPLSRMTYDKTTHETYFNGLVGALNNWVADNAGHSKWTRTMASTINDDYPVLMFDDFNVVGTEDGVYMKYDYNVNDMWAENGKNFKALTAADNPKAAMYLYKTNPTAISVTENTAVPLHIHQNVGVLQEEGKNLTARVGVTFDNSKAAPTQGGKFDWHMFSPALKAAPMGLTYFRDVTDYPIGANYATLITEGITDANYQKRAYMDPPRTEWNTEAGTIGYFPTNTPYGSSYYSGSVGASTSSSGVFDFYCFDEPSCHWINFKREGVTNYTDHWHQNPDKEGKHHHIDYVNETTMRVGKGYMMSVSEPSILMTDGVLNNGSFEADEFLRNTLHYDYGDDLRGINLVGNPYQSYLSFDALAADNECIGGTFYIYDEDELRYMSYTQGASDNDFLAPAYLHPHQGFLVRTSTDNVKLRFNNNMRFTKEQAGAPHFRNEKMNYPLVNLLCYSGEQLDDVTTVELNRPEQGGGYKLKSLYKGNSLLHVRMSGEDYQTAFTEAGTAAATVCFDALSEGNFTMRWQTMHGDFSYLHLIDHLTGLDIDCLRQNEYHFQGKPSDYNTRFKLVFEATDVEEHDDASANATTFAYFDGSAWMVTGSGRLDFIDLQGRVLHSTDLADGQTHVSLPKVATGMYLLRMTNQNGMKVQKIIVR